MKKTISIVLSIVLVFSFMPCALGAAADSGISITKAAGWLESAYVEFAAFDGADGYNVYSKAAGGEYVKLDAPLVREYPEYFRADAPGLAAGEYTLRVVPIKDGAEIAAAAAETVPLTVSAYDRSGFAFSKNSPVGTASGAYNDDGTLKENADVIYVTNGNKDTVTVNGDPSQGVGLPAILKYRQQKKITKPLAVRLIGKVEDPAGLERHTVQIQGWEQKTTPMVSQNLTIEGVGDDATVYGWLMCLKRMVNVEVRNLGVMYAGEGAEASSIEMDTDNFNIWIHNCDFLYNAPGKDADQAKGDGAVAFKSGSSYVTVSYNHMWDLGKNFVSGGPWENSNMYSDEAHYYATYHHNWFDHGDARMPRCVVGDNHVYNNYYDGVAMYGIGAAMKTSVFSECNYYRNVPRPIIIASQGSDVYDSATDTYPSKGTLSGQMGGMVKSFGDVFVTPQKNWWKYGEEKDTGEFDVYIAKTRDEVVPDTVRAKVGDDKGRGTYNNFDTNTDVMYDYTVQTADEAVETVKKYSGRLEGGDFEWTFDNAADDSHHGINQGLLDKITNYESQIVSVGGDLPLIPPEPEQTATPAPTATSDPNVTADPNATTAPTPNIPSGSVWVHNFTEQELTSDFITFDSSCQLKSNRGPVTYKGLNLTKSLEIGSTTEFKFTAPKDGTCTFVFSLKKIRVKINGEKIEGDTSTGLLTFDVKAGEEYVFTKYDNADLFYIELVFDEADATPEPTATPEADATATPEAEATATPEAEATATPEAEATATPEAEATATPEAEATTTPEAEATATPEAEATATPEAETTATPEAEATATPEAEATATPEAEATATPEAEATATPQPLEDQTFDGSAPKDIEVQLPESVKEVKQVTVGGSIVPTDNYTVSNGKVTFKDEFLKSLPNGENIIVIEDEAGNTYSVKVNVSNATEATPEPDVTATPEPTPTTRPSHHYGGGGVTSNSGFSTGTSTATATPVPTAAPNATSDPSATAAPGMATAAPAQSGTQVFEDVPADYWAYSYIMDLYNSGIINGETPTMFVPEDNITRAEFAKIAVMLFGITPGGTTTFADVAADDWFAPYVAAAEAAGIVNGTSDTTFSPSDNITREQIAAIVGRYLSLSSEAAVSYTDETDIEAYALPFVSALTEQGILTGSDGMFMPKSPATRAEVAAIMSRIKNR